MGDQQKGNKQIRDTFLKSRTGAVLRCAEFLIGLGRKDLAKQILAATRTVRQRLRELKP